MSDQRHDAVSRRAYELWEQEGGDHGRHEDHWHRASREVDGREVDETVTAPDGTTMPVVTAIETAGTAVQAPAEDAVKPARRRATAKSVPAIDAVPADLAGKAKAPAKPRKPKAK